VRKALAEPEVKAKFRQAGLDPAPGSPREFAAFIASETTLMGRLVKAAGMTPE
jgi:tripartite-type tricarboxylate transporter receptor subunit TctC